MEALCFPCLRHLSITLTSSYEDMWEIFSSTRLTSVHINDNLRLGISDDQDFVVSMNYLNTPEVAELWKGLEALEQLGFQCRESKDYELQAHKLVEEFCKLRNLKADVSI